jgi:dihydroflavonol-4-reductase
MKINLVTGATGVLGIQLVIALIKRGERVFAMYASDTSLSWSKRVLDFEGISGTHLSLLEWKRIELDDMSALETVLADCTTVYHCAAVVSYRRDERRRMYSTNVDGTRLLVNLCLERPGIRLCHVSSIAAIGRSPGVLELDEESEWIESPNNTHYAISKYLAELEVWRGIHEGLSAFIVCPGFIVGPGRPDRSSSSVIPSVAMDTGIYPPGGTAFIAAKDCANYMIHLMDSNITDERFILAEANLSHRDFFAKVAGALNISAPGRKAGFILLNLAVVYSRVKEWMGGMKNQVTFESIRNASVCYRYKTEKIGKFCGEISNTVNLNSAVADSVRFYLQNKTAIIE